MISLRSSVTLTCFATLCLLTWLLSSCSKPVDPAIARSAQYELSDIRYFLSPGDGVDTLILQLRSVNVQNPGPGLAVQQVETGFEALVKTSRFSVDPISQLPVDLDLSQFTVSVPEHWDGKDTFDRSRQSYSLGSTEQQKSYGFDSTARLTVTVPPGTKLSISRQITAYHLVCSFEGRVVNTTTGKPYLLRGKWRGLLSYANPSTVVAESAL